MSLSNEYKEGGVAPVHLMETYGGCVDIAPIIRTLDYIRS